MHVVRISGILTRRLPSSVSRPVLWKGDCTSFVGGVPGLWSPGPLLATLQITCETAGVQGKRSRAPSGAPKSLTGPAKPRQDFAVLSHRIRGAAEYYFSEEHLADNLEFRQRVLGNVSGYVPLVWLASQPRIKRLSRSLKTITACIRRSDKLVVDRRGVRRRVPPKNLPRTAQNSVSDPSGAPGGDKLRKMLLVVAAALIDGKGRVLLAQRPKGKCLSDLWEFPGGKVDPGERPEDALIRELKEELNIEVKYEDLKPLTFASHAYDDFHLLMPLFECSKWEGTLEGREGQEVAWVDASQLSKYDMPQADQPLIAPVQAAVARLAQSVISDAA